MSVLVECECGTTTDIGPDGTRAYRCPHCGEVLHHRPSTRQLEEEQEKRAREAIERVEAERDAWRQAYEELKAAMDYHDSYCTAGRRDV